MLLEGGAESGGRAVARQSSLAMTEALLRQVLALLPDDTPAQRSVVRRVQHPAAAVGMRRAEVAIVCGSSFGQQPKFCVSMLRSAGECGDENKKSRITD